MISFNNNMRREMLGDRNLYD